MVSKIVVSFSSETIDRSVALYSCLTIVKKMGGSVALLFKIVFCESFGVSRLNYWVLFYQLLFMKCVCVNNIIGCRQ